MGRLPDGKKLGDGSFKWAETFNNSDGDLPGVAGAGGYHEYYAERDPADTSPGFWGRNRVLHNITTGNPHAGTWFVTNDHYTNFKKITDA